MATSYGFKYRLLEIKHRFKERILAHKIVSKSSFADKSHIGKPVYIAMVDGSAKHGGMCDRFKGIITLYAYCKKNGFPFRIKYTYPFQLEDYLKPAAYDWRLKDDEYTDNPRHSKILYMRKEYLARRLLKHKRTTAEQIHFYGNRDSIPSINEAYGEEGIHFEWGELFRELFMPQPILEERINNIKIELGGAYNAAVFRFQNLLGDFKEYNFQPLEDKKKGEELIEKCLCAIRELLSTHKGYPLLVTSDSITFLKIASQIEGVHIIPGALMHMDSQDLSDDNSLAYEAHLKSFVDFYALSEAQKIYRIGSIEMYPSEFPVYAAKIHNIPFESLTI